MRMMWHGVEVEYVTTGDYCAWYTVSGRTIPLKTPWPPPRPKGYQCPYNHVACRSWPDAEPDEIRAKFAEFLASIGAKPGRYSLRGLINPDPKFAHTECILFEEIEL